jgi:hypothetical protein
MTSSREANRPSDGIAEGPEGLGHFANAWLTLLTQPARHRRRLMVVTVATLAVFVCAMVF